MAEFSSFACLSAAALLLLAGCVDSVGARHIVGPDGSAMLHVHCGAQQGACFQVAGYFCPLGYDLSPVFDPHDGNVLVRCHEASNAATIAAVDAPANAPAPVNNASANSNSSASTVQSGLPAPTQGTPNSALDWPPTEVAKPANPWPAPDPPQSATPSALPGTSQIY